MRQWFCASLMGALLASSGLASLSYAGEGQTTDNAKVSCQQLDRKLPEDDGEQWFKRSLLAERCYAFQAVALRLGMGSLRTFLFEHRINDGQEQERIQFLDGPAETIERQGHAPGLWWMSTPSSAPHLASIDDTVKQLAEHYAFRLVARDVVAGRKALVIDIAPRDQQRFPHRLWLDMASGLPLRQQLLSEQGHAVDTVQIVRLDSLTRFNDTLAVQDVQAEAFAHTLWRAYWLPEGFYRQPADVDVTLNAVNVQRQVYGDGLATFSVFTGPVSEGVALREGVHQLGNFRAAARHIRHDGKPWQVIAVGAIPAEVLSRVVSQVRWDGDAAKSEETERSASRD